jgi:hypothetical protein
MSRSGSLPTLAAVSLSPAEQERIEAQIDQLQRQLAVLREAFYEFRSGTSAHVNELEMKLTEVCSSKLEQLEEWAGNERAFTELVAAQELADCDRTFETERQRVHERMVQFLRFKFSRLVATFPDSISTFLGKSRAFPFQLSDSQDALHRRPEINFTAFGMTAPPHNLPEKVVYAISANRVLHAGNFCFPRGSRAVLTLSGAVRTLGHITLITPTDIEFTPDGEGEYPIAIPLRSLSSDLAAIGKD